MPFHKVTQPVDVRNKSLKYFGCLWKIEDGVVYADVPDYAVESYVKAGRVMPADEPKKEAAPKVKDVSPEKMSAEDVVSGNTVAAVEKKEARVEKAAEFKKKAEPKVVKTEVKVKAKSKSKGK